MSTKSTKSTIDTLRRAETWLRETDPIAPMDPLVWLALADWLGVTADGLARRGVTAHIKPAEAAALTIALRVLGEEA